MVVIKSPDSLRKCSLYIPKKGGLNSCMMTIDVLRFLQSTVNSLLSGFHVAKPYEKKVSAGDLLLHQTLYFVLERPVPIAKMCRLRKLHLLLVKEIRIIGFLFPSMCLSLCTRTRQCVVDFLFQLPVYFYVLLLDSLRKT